MLSLTGSKNDGLNYGLEKTLIRLDIASPGKRKTKETVLDI
jgi:hypothetical protein